MSYFAVNLLFLIVAGFGCLLIGALILNELPLGEPPGLARRLTTYLTTSTAVTRRNHEFPELELRSYRLTPDRLFARVEHALVVLNWHVEESDPAAHRLRAVVESRLLRFKDDVEIQLRLGDHGTEVHIRSSSRVGRGDFGANSRHIMDLHTTLAHHL